MGIREGAKGLISARWGVYPPGRTCSMDSALPTWNLPGALESRCGGSIMFSRTSASYRGDGGGTERKHRVTGKAGLGRRASEADKDLGGCTREGNEGNRQIIKK